MNDTTNPRNLDMGTLNPPRPAREWLEHALCRAHDTDTWYPARGDTWTYQQAVTTCSACPVQTECLIEALYREERFGIWGGCGERTRRKLRRAYPWRPCPTCGDAILSVELDAHKAACANAHAQRPIAI